MSPITTHVLDTSRGKPAEGVPITLEKQEGTTFKLIGSGKTDADGRLKGLLSGALEVAVYRITFDTKTYFASTKTEGFYPSVSILFEIRDASAHYHVPLLINPFGYSTYRGS